MNEKSVKTNKKTKKSVAVKVGSGSEIPRWKVLGFQDQHHYLDYKRNNDLDSIINDIDDMYDNYNW